MKKNSLKCPVIFFKFLGTLILFYSSFLKKKNVYEQAIHAGGSKT